MIIKLLLITIGIGLVLGSDVIDLKDSNFETKIQEFEVALVKFYAPWCGHCKNMAPEFEKAAPILKKNDPSVALVKVDCTVETKTCQKYGVSGYPTLKIFKNGKLMVDYNGPREADGIVKHMKSKAGPTSKELNTEQDVEKFLNNNEHSILGFFKSSSSSLATEFLKTADLLGEKYRFAIITNSDILAKYNYHDQIVIYQPPRLQVKLEPSESAYTGQPESSQIKDFIQNQIHGIVGHRTTENHIDFKRPLVIVLYNLDYVKDVKGSNYVRNRVIKVAQKLRSEGLTLNFAVSNLDDFRKELNEFGFENPKADSKYVIAYGENNKKYKLTKDYSPENLEEFSRDLFSGKLESYLKSEPIPTSNPDNVKTVVAKNFDEIVNDDSKDVLIEFYAPWCGHCKSLAPKYEELAKTLKNENEIVIAKMDATLNDVPSQYDVKGFPTIYFARKNSKNRPKKYEGGREVADFIKYIARESTSQLKGYDRSGTKLKGNAEL